MAPDVLTPLVHACELAGVQLLDDDKAKIEAAVDGWADNETNTVMTALAAHITMHGAAGMIQGPLRNAVTGSEPTVDQEINANVDAGLTEIAGILEAAAKK